jgi:PPK2 family polyphosphate:nucleotide phosphotransferase
VRELWRVAPGSKVDLAAIDTTSTEGAPGGKKETKEGYRKNRHELADLQVRLYAESRRSLLLVLQALDAGGKDGTIKHVFRGVNPQGTRVHSFKQPTTEELSHDFLWRVHQRTPGHGEITIFNRSHYEDVLIVRVHKAVPEKVWRSRYDDINAFERLLTTQAGTRIVKVFPHISKDEQKARFESRLQSPKKRWKFSKADLSERKLWNRYMDAFSEMLELTSTDESPWYVVPADHKWYRNWAVSRILIETLEEMNPQYPEPEDLDGIKIR